MIPCLQEERGEERQRRKETERKDKTLTFQRTTSLDTKMTINIDHLWSILPAKHVVKHLRAYFI